MVCDTSGWTDAKTLLKKKDLYELENESEEIAVSVYNSFNHFNNPYFDWFQSWNRKNQSTYSLAKAIVSLGSALKKAADVQVQYDMLVK